MSYRHLPQYLPICCLSKSSPLYSYPFLYLSLRYSLFSRKRRSNSLGACEFAGETMEAVRICVSAVSGLDLEKLWAKCVQGLVESEHWIILGH